jgi:PAS domain S-box-containing protein
VIDVSRRWVVALVAAVAVESALTVILGIDRLRGFAAGQRDFTGVTAVVGLGWVLVLAVTLAGTTRSLYAARRHPVDTRDVIVGLAATSRDWTWETDAHQRLTYCSPRVTDLLGYQPENLLGAATPALMSPADEHRAQQLFTDALINRHGWNDIEFNWRHTAGHIVTLQGSAVPILDRTGAVVGFRGSRRAVTDAMTAERALLAARQRIAGALTDATITTALQPIISASTGRLAGAEALARFADGRKPDRWFAEARETGQGLELDRLAFITALRTLAALPDGAYLSVNISPELLTDPHLRDLLTRGNLPLHRLVIEITEHVEIDHYDDIHAVLIPLRERGLRLAVDDTGAGYASFNHVLQLRPDIIKIDRSLISGVGNDPARRSLITALVLLALDFNATVTAECVETPDELNTLTTLGVDHIQGNLLARPSIDHTRWRTWHKRTWQQLTPPTALTLSNA